MPSCYSSTFTSSKYDQSKQLFKEESGSLSSREQSYKSWLVTSLFVWLEFPPESCARTLSPGLPLSHFPSNKQNTDLLCLLYECVCVCKRGWATGDKEAHTKHDKENYYFLKAFAQNPSYKETAGCHNAAVHTRLESLLSFIPETITERSYFQREPLVWPLPLMRSEKKRTHWNFLISSLFPEVKWHRFYSFKTKHFSMRLWKLEVLETLQQSFS